MKHSTTTDGTPTVTPTNKPWAPPLDIARHIAHYILDKSRDVDIHNHNAVVAEWAAVTVALRQVLDALNAEEDR